MCKVSGPALRSKAGEDASAWDVIRRSNKRKQGPESAASKDCKLDCAQGALGYGEFLVEWAVYVMSSGKMDFLRLDSGSLANALNTQLSWFR